VLFLFSPGSRRFDYRIDIAQAALIIDRVRDWYSHSRRGRSHLRGCVHWEVSRSIDRKATERAAIDDLQVDPDADAYLRGGRSDRAKQHPKQNDSVTHSRSFRSLTRDSVIHFQETEP
jgi:3'-phosphoadenosine 5'-phosphosulfate sulfotransferase